MIKLYHGTSSLYLDSIKKNGLIKPYLTNKVDLAKYYAECATEIGGKEIVFEVEVKDLTKLKYDRNAIDEPVAFNGYSIKDLVEKRNNMWQKQAKLHPEWISENGMINIPSNEYKLSLEVVASCYYDGVLPYFHLLSLEQNKRL